MPASFNRGNPLQCVTGKLVCFKLLWQNPRQNRVRSNCITIFLMVGFAVELLRMLSGRSFRRSLKKQLLNPLIFKASYYAGIPPGVESRLASLTVNTNDLSKLAQATN